MKNRFVAPKQELPLRLSPGLLRLDFDCRIDQLCLRSTAGSRIHQLNGVTSIDREVKTGSRSRARAVRHSCRCAVAAGRYVMNKELRRCRTTCGRRKGDDIDRCDLQRCAVAPLCEHDVGIIAGGSEVSIPCDSRILRHVPIAVNVQTGNRKRVASRKRQSLRCDWALENRAAS